MKLLIVTQKVDKNDPVLGFFHRWIEEFAKHFDSIVVICLEKGEYRLPSNVSVYSLGKEEKKSRPRYILNFYHLIWRLRNQYDSVFVHMNQEYVLLAGAVWRLMGKKVIMWRNHVNGSFLTRVAVFFSDMVMYTSPQSFTARFKKSIKMPVGVDTKTFSPKEGTLRVENEMLMLGRISPVKRVDVFIDSLKLLSKQGIQYKAVIVGDPSKDSEISYVQEIKKMGEDIVLNGALRFEPAVSHLDTPKIFAGASIFVNTTTSGSFDKTLIEAMASGAIPVTSNRAIEPLLSSEDLKILLVKDSDAEDLAYKLMHLFALDAATLEALRDRIVRTAEQHSLDRLIAKLVSSLYA